MRMVIDISGDVTEVDSVHLESVKIKKEAKIGDVYFMETNTCSFSN
jgi:hypothetical protein